MKRVAIFLMILTLSATSFSQQTNPSQALTKQDYLTKSKHQKTAAWIMLVGGAALGVGGIAVDASNWYSSGGDVMLAIGGAAMVGSIPLFVASGKNKKRSLSASAFFKMEKAPGVSYKKDVAQHSFPTASIRINL